MNTQLPEDFPWTEGMLESFFRQYLATAYSGGEPLDSNYGPEDIPQDVRDRLRAECIDFIRDNAQDLEFWLEEWGNREGAERAGHDFWLTRCGHGAGFWDRFPDGTDAHAAGDRLSEAARVYGNVDLYMGDDGHVYAAGYES